MKERGILFSAPMVRALLDGSKTQTRRVVKHGMASGRSVDYQKTQAFQDELTPYCPYGQPGDRLWVRETWSLELCGAFGTSKGYDSTYELSYPADDEAREIRVQPGEPDPYLKLADTQRGACRPSIHMPRWASRILLEVVSVRVERLQDISEADAMAEGAQPVLVPPDGGSAPHVEGYRELWEDINGAGSWDANPWVWVIEFKRVD